MSVFQQDRGHQTQPSIRGRARVAVSLDHRGEQRYDRCVWSRRRFRDARFRPTQRSDATSRRTRLRETRSPSVETGEHRGASSTSVEVRRILKGYVQISFNHL